MQGKIDNGERSAGAGEEDEVGMGNGNLGCSPSFPFKSAQPEPLHPTCRVERGRAAISADDPTSKQ